MLNTLADDDAIQYNIYDSGTSRVDYYSPERALYGLNITKNATDAQSRF